MCDCSEKNKDHFLDKAEFLRFAASVFKVDPAKISGETAYGSIPEWDSVNHLRLVMETEKRFGVYYPLERIPSLLRLADFWEAGAKNVPHNRQNP